MSKEALRLELEKVFQQDAAEKVRLWLHTSENHRYGEDRRHDVDVRGPNMPVAPQARRSKQNPSQPGFCAPRRLPLILVPTDTRAQTSFGYRIAHTGLIEWACRLSAS